MAIRPASLSSLAWLFDRYRRHWALILSIVLVLASMGQTRAKEDEVTEAYADLISRGPHEVLTINPAGKVIPKPQADPAEARLAEQFATSMENGRKNKFLKIGDNFEVTLTEAGKKFVENQVSEMSKGCAVASSVGADWTGFQATLVQTCSEAEVEERFGLEIPSTPEEVKAEEVEAEEFEAEASLVSMGFAPPAAPSSGGDGRLNSEDFNCLASILTAVGVLLAAILAVWMLTPFGWFVFGMTLALAAVSWVTALIQVVLNCTNLISMQVDKRVWVASAPLTLPVAGIGFGSIRIDDSAGPEREAYYSYPRVWCSRTSYWGYRYSSIARTSVPTGSSWRCP